MSAKVGCTECKRLLAGKIIAKIAPIQQKRTELSKDKNKIRKILDAGREKAIAVASKTIDETLQAINL